MNNYKLKIYYDVDGFIIGININGSDINANRGECINYFDAQNASFSSDPVTARLIFDNISIKDEIQ